jgi:hypothetical protein
MSRELSRLNHRDRNKSQPLANENAAHLAVDARDRLRPAIKAQILRRSDESGGPRPSAWPLTEEVVGAVADTHLLFPKIPSARIRAMRQNQRIMRRDACDPPAAWDVCRQPVQVAASA